MLAQRQDDSTVRPIAYTSRSLQPHEKKYGVTEMAGLGVVWVIKHFRPYLYGHPCEVFTDHSALTSLLNTPQHSGKLARWGMAIQELDLKIRHRPGRNTDALSKAPLPETVGSAGGEVEGVIASLELTEDLPTLQRQDAELAPIFTYLETGILPTEVNAARRLALTATQYTVEDNVLYRV